MLNDRGLDLLLITGPGDAVLAAPHYPAMVGEGVATHEQVNQLMVDCFRWPVGPFAMVEGATRGWK